VSSTPPVTGESPAVTATTPPVTGTNTPEPAEQTPPAVTASTPPVTGETENQSSIENLPDDHPVVIALRKANKEAADARAKVKEFEDRDKSELDLALEAAAEAGKAKAEAELENQRLRAAVDFGLSPEDLALLGDGPADGFRDRAKALAERLATTSGPRPNTIVGQQPDAAGSIDEQIAIAQKAGDVRQVIHLQNQKLASRPQP